MWVKSVCAGLVAAFLAASAAAPAPALLPDKATQEKIQALLKQRRDALREMLKGREAQFKAGRLTPDVLVEAHRALLATELELATAAAERVKLCEGLAKRSRGFEAHMKAAFDAGRITPGDLTAARAEARGDEVRLLRERAGPRPTREQAADLRKLRGEHRELLAKALEDQQKAFEDGRCSLEVVSRAARLKLEADLELAELRAEHVAAHRAYLAGAQHRADLLKQGFDAGRVGYYDRATSLGEKLAAEIALLLARGKVNPEQEGRLKVLQRDRRMHCAEAVKATLAQWEVTPTLRWALDLPGAASARLLKAELDLAEKPADRIAAHRARLKRVRQFEELVKAQHDAGRLTTPDYLKVKAARLGAEAAFVRAGGKPAELGN